jgi:predicted RNase H-like nuclease
MKFAGVDGAGRAHGWVLVVIEDDHLHTSSLHPDLRSVLAACPDAASIAIDMPIGHEMLDPTGKRRCDVEARHLLGPARARSVFWVPPPQVLQAPDVSSAIELCERRAWIRPSPLIWGLRAQILQAHEAAQDPRVVEVHPEVSFQFLAQQLGRTQPLRSPKATWDGLVERLELLHGANLRPTRSLGGLGRASPDDVLDATIAAWSARRHALGTATALPTDDVKDPETGRRVAIWA